MKCVLLSVKPQWVAKILNGEKTIEIRKRFPINYVGWVYIYCTKDSQHPVAPFHFKEGWFYKEYNDNTCYAQGCSRNMGEDINGKVVARFWCDVDELKCEFHDYELFGEDTVYQGIDLIYRDEEDPEWYDHYNIVSNEEGDTNEEVYENNAFLKRCCLTLEDFKKYAKKKETLYDIHISNLEIFDKPKELWEFKRPKWSKCGVKYKNGLYQCDKCPYGIPYSKVYYQCNNNKQIKAPQNYCYIEVKE